MGVPGADDVMLHYQSTSFHDALYVRRVLDLKPAPEFEVWLEGENFARLTREAQTPGKAADGMSEAAEPAIDLRGCWARSSHNRPPRGVPGRAD